MNEFDPYYLFFHPINVLSTILSLIVVLVWAHFKSNTFSDTKDMLLYRWNVYHKLFFSSVFALYYGFFIGGDTLAYWETMGVLKNLMMYDFHSFWEIMTTEPTMERLYGLFNHQTGYPHRFIYIEEESFFVTKILLIFRLITFDSYLASTFLLSFIVANASWKIYSITKNIGIFNKRLLAVFVLFLPSVAFWASGMSKDMIAFVAIMNIIYNLYNILTSKQAVNMKSWLFLLIFSVILYNIRPFILYAMLLPLTLMYLTGLMNRIRTFVMLRFLIKASLYAGVVGIFVYILFYVSLENLLISSDSFANAVIIQQDFERNTAIYGDQEGKRYSLGEVEYTPAGMLKVVPASIIAGIYRPFMWEALRPSLIFNGLESVLLVVLTIWFFLVKPGIRIKAIQSNELLVFSVGFILIIAFMAGFTSILFGVLVRIRIPLLPFFGLLLSIDWRAYLLTFKNTQRTTITT